MMIGKRCWFNNLFGYLKKVSGIHTLLRSVIVRYLTCQSYIHVISFFSLGHNTSLCYIFGDVSLLDLPTNVVELEPETDWQQSNNVEGSLCNMISLCSPRTKWLNVTKPLSWNVTSLDDDDFYLHDDGGDDADLQYKERSTQIDEAKPLSPHTAMLPNSNWRLIWINQS